MVRERSRTHASAGRSTAQAAESVGCRARRRRTRRAAAQRDGVGLQAILRVSSSHAIGESLNAAFAREHCAQLELLGDGDGAAVLQAGGGHLLTRLGALASDSVSTSSDSPLSQLGVGAHSSASVPLGFACSDAAAFAAPALTPAAGQYPTSFASYILEPAAAAVAPDGGYTDSLWTDWHAAQTLAAAPASTSASTSTRQVLVHMSSPAATSLSLSVPTPAASICTRTFSSYSFTCPTPARSIARHARHLSIDWSRSRQQITRQSQPL